ncbi:unnamed protein product [Oppiella nova]|uniref:Uncharacterized protein n=1 Tax=Oppiella nova TaxID=334625 RepID=A0A7R9QL53_9ACAR|nr:unnamed protein product [Oppiella nova]CAG2167795.1 unnamed protein product [Oppiella nova]
MDTPTDTTVTHDIKDISEFGITGHSSDTGSQFDANAVIFKPTDTMLNPWLVILSKTNDFNIGCYNTLLSPWERYVSGRVECMNMTEVPKFVNELINLTIFTNLDGIVDVWETPNMMSGHILFFTINGQPYYCFQRLFRPLNDMCKSADKLTPFLSECFDGLPVPPVPSDSTYTPTPAPVPDPTIFVLISTVIVLLVCIMVIAGFITYQRCQHRKGSTSHPSPGTDNGKTVEGISFSSVDTNVLMDNRPKRVLRTGSTDLSPVCDQHYQKLITELMARQSKSSENITKCLSVSDGNLSTIPSYNPAVLDIKGIDCDEVSETNVSRLSTKANIPVNTRINRILDNGLKVTTV